MEKKYISIDQLWKCETCFYMGSNGKCRSDCDAGESYRPAYSKFEFADVVLVVHGEWIEGAEHFTNGFYDAECSKCGTYISWNEGNSGEWHYCPNRGAKMDGGKSND